MILGPEEIIATYYQGGSALISPGNVDAVYYTAAKLGRLMIMKDIEAKFVLNATIQYAAIWKMIPIAPFPISLEYVSVPPPGFTPAMRLGLQRALNDAYPQERQPSQSIQVKNNCIKGA